MLSQIFRHAIAAACAALIAAPSVAQDWVLSHGPFVTASDVTPHNALPQDLADIRAALAADPPRWAEALEVFTFGRHFPWRGQTHSIGRFGDDYNGAMPRVTPLSVTLFGTPSYAAAFTFSAIAGTNRFQGAPDAVRAAATEAGALASIINWTRFELAMSRTKALAAEPNWSLQNGSPKNWNEIFAFHYGPDGRHSVFEALEAVEGGSAINAGLMQALADGQDVILTNAWAEDAGADVARLLDRGAMTLFLDRLRAAVTASGEDQAVAHARAAGLWLAGAETMLAADPDAAQVVHAAMTASPNPMALELALEAAEAVAAALTDS
jgi:hypothetical protein